MAITEDTLRGLREQINQATADRARAQAGYDAAVEQRDKALAGLKEFGVSTPAEAAARLKALETELEQALAEVEQGLMEAGE